MNYTKFMEALKGKQHKIDKNKNGKIDAHDFKLLQKEEAEQLEEGLDPSEVAGNPRMYSADTVKKAFYHKKASAGDKESLARHLDRHHGNKDWRKSVKEEAELTEATVKSDKVVHTRTGADGAKYHIMQDSPSDYSIHREHNGKTKHIDTYGSLNRAKSVLDNEVKEEVEQIDYLLEYPEDLQKMKKADSYKVGDKVFTKVGGKWHKGHVTTPLNKAGNHGVKFQHNGKTHSYVSSPDQLRLHVEEVEHIDEIDMSKTLAAFNKDKPHYAQAKIDTRTSAERRAETDKKLAAQKKPFSPTKMSPTSKDDMNKQIAKSYADHKPGQYVGDSYELNGEVMSEESLDEKLNPSMGAGEYIKDFQKSDAPQFAGKSKEKRRVMGIAAYLSAKSKMKEEAELTEATVKTQKYSWGTMKTIHHGSSFSIPLHPEHHQEIAKLKDQQEHKFKDETGRHWTAKRMGDDVHLHSANDGPKTKVKHSDLVESHAPVAPVPDKKYIKGTPENIAYKATKQPRVGHPTGQSNKLPMSQAAAVLAAEETEIEESSAHKKLATFFKNREIAQRAFKKLTGGSDEDQLKDLQKRVGVPVTGKKPVKEDISEEDKKKNDLPFDGPYSKTKGTTTDKSGAVHTPMSRARHLAKMAMKKMTKEDIEEAAPVTVKVNHALEAPHEEEWEATGICPEHNKKDCHECGKAGMKEQVEEIQEKSDQAKQNKTMKNLMAASKGARLNRDSGLKLTPGDTGHSNAQQMNKALGRHAMRENEGLKSYKEFMMMLEYESDKSGSYKHKGTYGSEYAKKEREKDEEGFDSEPTKRGPKMGSKRGPKANLGSSKLHTK